MTDTDTPPQIVAANKARVAALATIAALDDDKLRRAVNIVVAALALERLTFSDLRRELEARAEKASA
jgi:hypothetical protein